MKQNRSNVNVRIIKKYSVFLKEAKRQQDSSIDSAVKAINRFEESTGYKDFKHFHFEQAIGFKNYLIKQKSISTGEKLSKSTLNTTLHHLKAFFQWLSMQNGYRSRLNYCDMEYFNLSRKDTRIATAKRKKPIPTLNQITNVLQAMPSKTDIEKRDRALIAFIILTGARVGAVASMKIKHIDLKNQAFDQDAREVETKFSKTFTSYFFPVGEMPLQIVTEWVEHLTQNLLFSSNDPLFPKTKVEHNANKLFAATGLLKTHWKTTNSIRTILKQAFEVAKIPYFGPHSYRKTLVQLGETLCRTPEDFKAWSQNMGHEEVLTTFYSYGEVSDSRQAELLRELAKSDDDISPELEDQFRQFKQFQKLLEKDKA